MSTPTAVSLTPVQIEDGLCFYTDRGNGFRIECNWCSDKGYVFSDMPKDSNPSEGWLQRAADHMVANHAGRLGIS